MIIVSDKTCSELRASIAGKDLPEDIKQRLLSMHEENLNLKESHRTLLDKLTKAKQVISLWSLRVFLLTGKVVYKISRQTL